MTRESTAASCGGVSKKKRHRPAYSTSGGGNLVYYRPASASSTNAVIENCLPDGALEDATHRRTVRRSSSSANLTANSSSPAAVPGGFNDPATADVILRLFVAPGPHQEGLGLATEKSYVLIYLHSKALSRSKYFDASLSDRWLVQEMQEIEAAVSGTEKTPLKLSYGATLADGSFDVYLNVLKLLYSHDLVNAIGSVGNALAMLPVAMELLFEDCVKACVSFLEAVPWTEEEERKVLAVIPLLSEEESDELMARLTPQDEKAREEMLQGVILSALYNHPNGAFVKAFVAKLLRDFSSRESAKRVLEIVFGECLKVVRESLEQYSSPEFRAGSNTETEAIQRINLHTAMTSARHLFWVIERMIDMKVADFAVKVWSEQESLSAELLRVFRDDASRQMVPGFATIMLRCISRLASAVASGSIVACRSVRMKLVKEWLPVLNACKDIASQMMPAHKTVAVELEETFLKIISTLPMSDSQEMLKHCLSFSTRNVDDCSHLVSAFNTWFSRASRPLD
uniref:At3g05675-like ankyrin-like domain-containing protein n=1 Tax=Kalanchoe fedtschenkoi TaxID=63787 RepID=A0A7N0T1Y1_KALFE